jgi:2-amino-4-hydroxy-6-hydroxymethyldihydropteridine diphosphokinase
VILVAVGANLPGPQGQPPLDTCRAAVEALAALPRLGLVAVSRWYQTAPVPPSDQPLYINGVVRLDGDAEPAVLLAQLHTIEAAAGRVRGARNAARVLDLDLIDLHGLVRDAPDPVLPHPRADSRAFVLLPLADVAPDWRHPRLGRSVADLIAALTAQDIVAL